MAICSERVGEKSPSRSLFDIADGSAGARGSLFDIADGGFRGWRGTKHPEIEASGCTRGRPEPT